MSSWAVNIRKFVLKSARLSDLVRLGSMPPLAARFLEAAVLAGQNLVVASGTQAGKVADRRVILFQCPHMPVSGGQDHSAEFVVRQAWLGLASKKVPRRASSVAVTGGTEAS